MTGLRMRLIVAFAAVALVSVAATAAITGALVRRDFDRYFSGIPMMDRPLRPPGPEQMRSMMHRVMGPPEIQFLAQLRRATWRTALLGLLVAVILGAVVAGYVTAPLRRMAAAAARVGQGDLTQQVPVSSDDELGRLAQAFNAMTVDLRQLDESRRHLVADIAHELGTPLSILQANLEGMLDGVVETDPDRLAALHTQVRLLGRLVNDLRDLSLAQAGRLHLDRRPVELAALLSEAIAVMLPRADEKGVEIRSELASSVDPVPVDRDRTMQIVHNLLDNAVRHTPSGGRVTVGLTRETDAVRITVTDSGPGIPGEEQDRVFDRFHRLDPSRARASGGSGLGLAIVKSLVEAHGGRVWVTSRAGSGATFAVALPLRPASPGGA